jgi:glutamate decarboxylase
MDPSLPALSSLGPADTFQEEEAEKLMAESFSKNFIDYEECKSSFSIRSLYKWLI